MTAICVRTDCTEPAVTSAVFDHDAETLTFAAPAGETAPHRYDLCAPHGDFSPPTGWTLAGRDARRLHVVTG